MRLDWDLPKMFISLVVANGLDFERQTNAFTGTGESLSLAEWVSWCDPMAVDRLLRLMRGYGHDYRMPVEGDTNWGYMDGGLACFLGYKYKPLLSVLRCVMLQLRGRKSKSRGRKSKATSIYLRRGT